MHDIQGQDSPGSSDIRSLHGGAFRRAPASAPQISEVFDALHRHWAVLASTTLMVLALAFLYLLCATPQYAAHALVLIDTKADDAVLRPGVLPTDPNVQSSNIETEVEVLRSEGLMRHLVEATGLAGSAALAPGTVEHAIKDVRRVLTFWAAASPSNHDAEVTSAARALEKRTSASRIGLTRAVELSATMPDPTQAAEVANAYARVFMAAQRERREEAAERLKQLIDERTARLQDQAAQAERSVEQLKFSGSLAGENSAAARVTLRNLESAAQTYRALHDKFLERSAELAQQQFLSVPDAEIASPAFPPQAKSSPKTLIVLAAALAIGLALGWIRAILRDRRVPGLRP